MIEEYQLTLPKLGESIVSATVVQWFKKEGDTINFDEPLLEVSTDKVNSEIPSPVSGVLSKIVANIDQELAVGDPLALIQLHPALSGEAPPSVAMKTGQEPTQITEMKNFYSPALLRLARENNIGLNDLEKIPATGAGGRLSKRDLEAYIEKKISHTNKPCAMITKSLSTDIERIKMTSMRKAIADNMIKSFYEAPHATLITEVDLTPIVKLIQQQKESFLAKHGAKLTVTSFVSRAISRALSEYPFLNSSLEDDTIVVKRYVNLGIAVSVEQGVMVPVIRGCQNKTIPEFAKAIGDLSTKARAGKLTAEEVKEGTVTLTNFGIAGVMIGIPIIRYPEVAIIGMGAITKKVVALCDETFAIRSMIHLSLTFDHRVIDGMYGCGFLKSVKGHLEKETTL